MALLWSWDGLVVGYSAWHCHNLSTSFLGQGVMQGKRW